MTDHAFLEALKALTLNSIDPDSPFTSQPETTESANARLAEVIQKFRETGVASAFPLGNETPRYGYNHLQSESAEQTSVPPLPAIDLPLVPLPVLHQWYGILCSALHTKEGSLTQQEWRGITNFRDACLGGIQRHNDLESPPPRLPGQHRLRRGRRPQKAPSSQSDHRRRSESPSPRSRSPPRIRASGRRGQKDEEISQVTQGTTVPPYLWLKVLCEASRKGHEQNSLVDIYDLDDAELISEVAETKLRISQSRKPLDYRKLLELKVGWEIRSRTLTRHKGEELLGELTNNENGLKKVEEALKKLRSAKRGQTMVILGGRPSHSEELN